MDTRTTDKKTLDRYFALGYLGGSVRSIESDCRLALQRLEGYNDPKDALEEAKRVLKFIHSEAEAAIKTDRENGAAN